MIFHPSQIYHTHCNRASHHSFPQTFSLLCWNVHKQNRRDSAFQPFLQKLIAEKELQLSLLQEAEFYHEIFTDHNFSYDAAANLQIKKRFYGVLTASRTESTHAEAYLSQHREGLVGPHKSLLSTHYRLEGGKTLLVLNLHAINFRETHTYEKELDLFAQKVASHQGPMIVAGDFNAWNGRRREALHTLCKTLSLTPVAFEPQKVTSFMGYALDFILYRDMVCLQQEVYTDHTLSDHHPLLATFSIVT